MSTQIAPQHPSVVLRSHYVHLRSLLAAAMVAVVGLAAAVVILATNSSTTTITKVSRPVPVSAQFGSYQQELRAFGLSPQQATRESRPGTRLDGGPQEGSRGSDSVSTSRFDGRPDEGIAGH